MLQEMLPVLPLPDPDSFELSSGLHAYWLTMFDRGDGGRPRIALVSAHAAGRNAGIRLKLHLPVMGAVYSGRRP